MVQLFFLEKLGRKYIKKLLSYLNKGKVAGVILYFAGQLYYLINCRMKVKVLQRNVWFRERAENLLTLMKELNPDIICCQEITVGS